MPVKPSIRLLRDSSIPFPTVTRILLEEQDYRELLSWAGEEELYLTDPLNRIEVYAQLSDTALTASPDGVHAEHALYLLIPERPDGTTDEITLHFAKREKASALPKDRQYNPWEGIPGVYLDRQDDKAQVVVSIDGELFTRYLYSLYSAKPYYYPLIGPAGKSLIQDSPDDHLHHHGLWWGHDDVNGHKLYHEFRGEGRQVHREFLAFVSGPVFGQLTTLIDWLDEDGEVQLQETRTVRIYRMPPESRYIDICTMLYAVNGDVRFGDTKEGGFPFIRVNEQINGHQTGTLTSADGAVGEAEIFGKVTEWVDYSGTLKAYGRNIPAGIAVLSHPENETYASQWFVRDYGPFTPANFHFCGGKLLKQGERIEMKHRILLHQGDVVSGRVKDRYMEFVRPLRGSLTIHTEKELTK